LGGWGKTSGAGVPARHRGQLPAARDREKNVGWAPPTIKRPVIRLQGPGISFRDYGKTGRMARLENPLSLAGEGRGAGGKSPLCESQKCRGRAPPQLSSYIFRAVFRHERPARGFLFRTRQRLALAFLWVLGLVRTDLNLWFSEAPNLWLPWF
jgi:hypothetical protein